MSAAEQLHTEPSRVLLMRGSFDTLKERAGATYASITLAEIEAMAREPATAGKKQAPCAIFSTYLAHDGRTHQVQAEQGQYIALPGDIDQGNPHIAEVDAAIVAVYGNVRRLIYSTASATPVNRKWRFIIELAAPIPGEIYADVQLAAFSLMREQGITCDPALSRPGQVAYLPNVPAARRGADGVPLFYDFMVKGTELFSVSGSAVEARMIEMMREAEQAHRQAQEAAHARREARTPHATGAVLPNVIDAYNAQESIDDLLASYGYRRHGRDWQSPNQTSGSYATRVMDGGDAWVSLSESDVAAGLGTPGPNGGCWGDAFDLFKHYEHGGDHAAAMAAAAKQVLLPNGRTLDQARRDEWKAQQGGDGVEIDLDALRRNSKQGGEDVNNDDHGKDKPPHPLLDFLDISTDVIEAPEFIIDDVLQAGVIVVAGASGAGKTTILVPLMAVAAGLCPPGYPLRARLTRRVIYVTEDPEQVKRILASFMRFSDFQVDEAALRDRFRIVRAQRLATHNIVKVAKHYAEMAITNQSEANGRTYDAAPVVVFDTTNASIDLDDENSNAEVGKAIAMLKARFEGIPAILTGHTAKVNKKTDVDDLSARGAGAWGADAHQNVFIVTDEHDPKARYLSIKGKKRFEAEVDEFRFTTVARQVMAVNKLGEPVPTWIRHAVPDASNTTREEIRETAKEKAAEVKIGALMDAIVAVVQEHNDKGIPINRMGARAGVRGNNELKGAAITRLILDGALIEVKPEEAPRKNFGMALLTRKSSQNELSRKYREAKNGE